MDNARPRAVIFAGPNGSGKSTLIRLLFAAGTYHLPSRYINADDIARDLTEGSQLEKEKAAFLQARHLRRDYRMASLSFSFETVFSHPSTLLDLLKLRSSGYEVTFIFVATENVETNVRRVEQRFKSGGHDVPIEKIRSRYERAFTFLPLAAEIADAAFVWDNTLELRRMCSIENGVASTTADCTPFYEARFVTPLNARRERDALHLHHPTSQLAEIENGIYTGLVDGAATYYCVQSVNGQPVLHDRTLLTSEPAVGQTVQITYRDGYGTIEPQIAAE